MWWLFGMVLVLLFVLIVYERYRFFIEKFEAPLPTTLMRLNEKEKQKNSSH
ncbi:MAG: hypothetical protein OQL19_02980 [Gammaproteobacteria bacterium]|nr:hypothetical protein [Gammaproteobacteria bacterium]